MANKRQQGKRTVYPSSTGARERKLLETAIAANALEINEEFRERPTFTAGAGYGDPVGTDTAVNIMKTERTTLEYFVNGTATAVAPSWSASNGLDIVLDETNGEGAEYTPGIGSRNKRAFTAGTDTAFVEMTLKISDVSGAAELAVGFRKAAAYAALIDDYTDAAFLNVQGGTVKIETILNNAATITTTTSKTVADNGTVTLRVEVDKRGNCKFLVDGREVSASSSMTFDSGDQIIPFLHYLHGSDVANDIFLTSWKTGNL